MSITDELREAINALRVECKEEKEGYGVIWRTEPTRDRFSAIADRIDGRWEQEEADFDLMCDKIAAQATCLVEVGEALGVSADQPDSEFFWELAEAARGCVQLPKDADGETIRVGERAQSIGSVPGIVSHMSLADDGWRVYVKCDGGNGTCSGQPEYIRHAYAPTVEDVLEELLREYDRDDSELTDSEIIERFAAKLRLAGEDA